MGVPIPEHAAAPRPKISDTTRRIRTHMIQSGIAPLDERLGGVAPARIHLLTGGLGSGKTAACLHFIDAALREGQRAAMLSGDRGSDLKALATYLGIDLDTPLREGRLTLLRYRSEFTARFRHLPAPERALLDLRTMMGSEPPSRIAIDPLDPFLGEGGPVTAGSLALVNFLEGLGATALVTHSSDAAGNLDRRLDPIIARSVAVLRLERGHGSVHYLGVVRARVPNIPTAPIAFEIRAGSGIQRYAGSDPAEAREKYSPPRSPRKLLVLHTSEAASTEIVALLQRDYEVSVRRAPAAGAALDLAADSIDAIVVAASHDSVAPAMSLIARVNEHPHVVPIVLAARFNLRSIDRAHAMRAGADEILASDMSPPEFLQRLARAVSRPHSPPAEVTPRYSETLILQPETAGALQALDRDEFARALADHVAHDNPTQYTVVTLAVNPDATDTTFRSTGLRVLLDLVMRSSRSRSGDLTALIEDRVAIYLHGARQPQADSFVARIRGLWAVRHRASLRVETFPYPSGEPKLRTIFELAEQA
jgi:KaiC/GvpD/RAD55 family RecA-like ATPase/DNA-binding response OmpR family regulator